MAQRSFALVIDGEYYDNFCKNAGQCKFLQRAEHVREFIEATAHTVASGDFPSVSDYQTSVFDKAVQELFDENLAKPQELAQMLNTFNLHAFAFNVSIATRLNKPVSGASYEVKSLGAGVYLYEMERDFE